MIYLGRGERERVKRPLQLEENKRHQRSRAGPILELAPTAGQIILEMDNRLVIVMGWRSGGGDVVWGYGECDYNSRYSHSDGNILYF